MKVIIKNFLFILKRFKISSILTIIGLSVAFSVFNVIIIQTQYDLSYNRNFSKYKSINQFYIHRIFENEYQNRISTPLAKEIFEKFPEIIDYCLISLNETYLAINNEDRSNYFHTNITQATTGFTEVFIPDIIYGNPQKVFSEKGYAMITESFAKKLFGDNNPIGQVIIDLNREDYLTIEAVCKDFPKNCDIKNGTFTYLPDDEPDMFNYAGYFEINRNNIDNLLLSINSERFFGDKYEYIKDQSYYGMIPISKVYLSFPGKEPLYFTLSLFFIGILVFIIAYINYINFSISMTTVRIRGINIQKVLGANKLHLKLSILMESVLFTIIAFIFSLLIIHFAENISFISSFFSANISLQNNVMTLIFICLFCLIFSFLIGFYPANYLLSSKHAITLRSNYSVSAKNLQLRNILTIVQFTSAIILIIIASFITIQHNFMKSKSWGFPKENIVYIHAGTQKEKGLENFINKLTLNPNITDYTFTSNLPGNISMTWTQEDYENSEQQITVTIWPVGHNFLNFLGIEIIDGRYFRESDYESREKIILNKNFLNKYGLTDMVGKNFMGYYEESEIIGISEDINFNSLRESIKPMGFWLLPSDWCNWILIKITGNDVPETINYIKSAWAEYNDNNVNVHFLNETINNLYRYENNLAKLIGIFSIITIIIAIMGVFGLILFNSKYKEKEIAIRKVNGASVKGIILLLNKNILIQFFISFIIAIPISYIIIIEWLEGFAYKTPVYWWIFLLGGVIVFIITLVNVSGQSYRSATANPTKALKKE